MCIPGSDIVAMAVEGSPDVWRFSHWLVLNEHDPRIRIWNFSWLAIEGDSKLRELVVDPDAVDVQLHVCSLELSYQCPTISDLRIEVIEAINLSRWSNSRAILSIEWSWVAFVWVRWSFFSFHFAAGEINS